MDNNKNNNTLNVNTENSNIEQSFKKAAENRRRLKLKNRITTFVTVLVFSVLTFVSFLFIGKEFTHTSDANNLSNSGASENTDSKEEFLLVDKNNMEMRGVWIASVININYPSKTGLSEKQLKKELDDIIDNTLKAGLNSIFFQVRPTSDSLYKSEIFPYSKYISGTQGISPDNDFDSLEYLLEKASEHGLSVHAWVNPYRITMYEKDIEELSSNNPAVLHPEYTVKYADGKMYYNPGLPEVRKLIIDGVVELATNYPALSGIHFDDYFYPYPKADAEFDDKEAFELYGNGMEIDDWRRNNINMLIEDTYNAIKSVNPDIMFGVSPFGIWANETSDTPVKGSSSTGIEAYNDLYCDALAWANGGYIDYIIPQIYWSFSTSAAPFDNIARWWNANLDGTGVDFYIGYGAYKAKDYDKNEIGIQIEFARTLMSYKGGVFYGYEDIKNNTVGLKDKLAQMHKDPIVYSDSETSTGISVLQPAKGYTSTTPSVTIVGTSDTALPLEIENEKVSRTKSGLFSYYGKLKNGVNDFVFTQNGNSFLHKINYDATRQAAASSDSLPYMMITDILPSGETWIMSGDKLTISCVAPARSTVTAVIGGMSVKLKPTLNKMSSIKYAKEIYMGEITPSNFVKDGEILPLGTLTITATLNNETVKESAGLIKQMGKNALVFAEVINDYSHLKTSTTSSFYDDYTPASKGMRDYITGLYGSFYKLKFGGYISSENVRVFEGMYLNENEILSVDMKINASDYTNNKHNFTDIIFECTENAPVNAVAQEGKITMTFYNTDTTVIPSPNIIPNPLVSTISASVKNNTLVYNINLKDAYHSFGYNVVYENGNIILRLNNPQTLYPDSQKPLFGKTIVLDAGHGGNDSGALGCGKIHEADLNLDITLHLKNKLESLGANIILTRENATTTVSLEERMEKLNDINPDLAISVHQNSMPTSANAQKVRGFLGLYSTEAGRLAAKTFSSRISADLNRYERPFAYQKLAVARNHRFPSTLCEMCFISNVEEYQWSITPGNTERSAVAIANAVIDYYKVQEAYLAY